MTDNYNTLGRDTLSTSKQHGYFNIPNPIHQFVSYITYFSSHPHPFHPTFIALCHDLLRSAPVAVRQKTASSPCLAAVVIFLDDVFSNLTTGAAGAAVAVGIYTMMSTGWTGHVRHQLEDIHWTTIAV